MDSQFQPPSPENNSVATTDDITTDTKNLYLNEDDDDQWQQQQPLLSFTENNSATYISSQNPCLDFFFHVVPDTSPQDVINRVQSAWAHDPLTTLKLICNLRGVRGSGKSDKQCFYIAALWLHHNHPKTLANNVANFVEFGYFKDLLEILYRIVKGHDVREKQKHDWLAKKMAKGRGVARKRYFLSKKKKREETKEAGGRDTERAKRRESVSREERVEANKVRMEEEKERAKALRREKEVRMVGKANDMYNSDMNYKYLHDKVSLYFAICLKSDIDMLNSGDKMKISLAAKWCPSVDSSYDKALLMCESIGKILYPRNGDLELEGLDEVTYVIKVKNRLRKEVLVPLHSALMLPEVYMSAKEWSLVCYERVASIAMKKYTDIFLHRDNKRFREYLENVKAGDAKIAAGALLPHDIIRSLNRGSGAGIVAELQWKRMVDDLLNKGKLTNCIAVCDVSGSMSGTPMEVSVALGLLVSELSAEPWKGHVITFSQSPELHLIEGRNLRSKTEFIRNMDWGFNTNFQRVFDKMLEVAVNGKLSEDDMVKRVFVFSDMEFDQASSDPWETDYEAIQRKFKSCGYEKVPEIVFWNLRDSPSTPVTANQKGVALLSGFSKNLLTLFLEEGGVIKPEDMPVTTSDGADTKTGDEGLNPESTMEAAISGELYQKLVVCD
uniref:uncharacterized protein LOC122600841 n=1 Tax=Erigeron canadensis TaxID=72917 RepID=UPI001CB9140E|nr:uncharacterized protein LOC122600841 [Erigeron canadensis]